MVLQTSGATAPGEFPRVKLTKLRPGKARFANRGEKRGATVISFRLSRQVQIVLAVKGPGPSCQRVGRGQILGRAGLNRVRFDGTVRKVPLKPGTYRLDARLKAGGRLLGTTYVTIVDPRAPSKKYVRPECSAKLPPGTPQPTSPVSSLRDLGFTVITASTPAQRDSSEPAKPTNADSTEGADGGSADEQAEVLGELTPPEAGGVPLNVTDDGERSVLELILLAILAASSLSLLTALYVTVRRGRRFI